MDRLMDDYAKVIFGENPENFDWTNSPWTDSLDPRIFLRAVQALGVAEHRRYARFEGRGGGRYLPARLASGIVDGKWRAGDAKAVQKKGRPGLEWLIEVNGAPKPLHERAGVKGAH
jgi:hypothetical protein